MQSKKGRNGFTLAEVLIVITATAILVAVSLVMINGYRGRTELDSTARKIATALRTAQARSISQDQGKTWGIHFENPAGARPFFATFYSPYNSSTLADMYPLPPSVYFVTSTVPFGSSQEVTFNQITGAASASTSITLRLYQDSTASATISIASSGVIFY